MFKKKITFIGGTGASVIGEAAKNEKKWDVCLMVSLVDDGGSTGRLRRDLSIPPVGDIRKAINSLSTVDNKVRKAFGYRFLKGELKGHTSGNIFLAGLIQSIEDINVAIKEACKMLEVKGKVLTTTLKMTEMKTIFSNGKTIRGEDKLDENRKVSFGNPVKYLLVKDEKANPEATKRLQKSDFIVLGPGDLGANAIAPILTKGIRRAIKNSKARLIYIGNLMTKRGETHNMQINDCVMMIESCLKRKFDYIIINNKKIPKAILDIYKKQGEKPMKYYKTKLSESRKVIYSDLINKEKYIKPKSDKLRRSVLRHSGKKVVNQIKKIINTR